MGESDLKLKRQGFMNVWSALLPALTLLPSTLIATSIPWLLGAYNYLMGTSSQIDQLALQTFGSDLSRVIIFSCAFLGLVGGGLYSRYLICQIENELTDNDIVSGRLFAIAMMAVLIGLFISVPNNLLSLAGISSQFVTDLTYFSAMGWFFAYAIPMIIFYVRFRPQLLN